MPPSPPPQLRLSSPASTLLAGLKNLARYREATLLVTNLRPALCPPDRRWTARRQQEYDESLALIRDLAAARSRPSASLNLLFL